MNVHDCVADYNRWMSRTGELLSGIPKDCAPPRVIFAWGIGGLLTPTWTNGALARTWLNVIAHQAAVSVLAYRISDGLKGEALSVPEIVEAALVHDFWKQKEDAAKNDAKAKGEDVAIANRRAELDSARLLRDIGFSDNVVSLTKATGDLGLETIRTGEATLSQKIMFYSDCCVSGDEIATYRKRFDELLPHFMPGGRYDWVDAFFIEKYGKPHHKIYDEAVLPVQEEIARLLGFAGDSNELPLFLCAQKLPFGD